MTSKRVLIQCGDHLENHQRLLALASDLLDRGWQPVMLCYKSRGVLFLRHGIDVYSLDLQAHEELDVVGSVSSHLRGLASLATNTSFGGLNAHEVFTVERTRAPLRFAQPARRAQGVLSLLRRARRIHIALERTAPAHVMVWNGWTGEVANVLRQLCAYRGISHSFLERGLLPDSVFVDAKGVNGNSQLHRDSLESLGDRLSDREAEQANSARPQVDYRDRFHLGAKRILFVPLQVQRDTNILFHSDQLKSMAQFVEVISNAAPSDAVVVVRQHPEETDTALGLPDRGNLRYIDEGDVESWCTTADLTITINSTVGLTALLLGRALVSFGRAIYTGKGLTTESRIADLRSLLHAPQTYESPRPADIALFRRALLELHTAGPDSCPDFLGPAPASALEPSRFNAAHIKPAEIAKRWDAVLARALHEVAERTEVQIWTQLESRDTADLSYRNLKTPVSDATLRERLALLLRVDPKRLLLKAVDSPSSGAAVVVTPQARRPRLQPGTLLVVDQYLEPHLTWLMRA